MNKLLEIDNLKVFFFVDPFHNEFSQSNNNEFKSKDRIVDRWMKSKISVKAVDNVSFDIFNGEILGIAGESGSGKSVTAHSIINLIPSPPGKILSGEILYKGKDILKLSKNELKNIRGKEIGMIFQEPSVSLNPVLKIKSQIFESLMLDKKLNKKDIKKKALTLLKDVGITNPESSLNSYPHQLSGGMKQRIMIAIALSRNPSLLIADEPTTSLDVTTQKQIIDLLVNIKKSRTNFSILLITHNLGLIKQICDRVIIMYGGKIQEIGEMRKLFENPLHPYTKGLVDCFPDPNSITTGRINGIPGNIPDAIDYPSGCKFHPRCKDAINLCEKIEPELLEKEKTHFVRCHLYKDNNNIDE
jgi:oligopeptide/dipeptide ABC transporter ATP-binding protein